MAVFKVAHTGSSTSTHIRTKPPKAKKRTQVAKVGPPASLHVKKGPPKGPRRFQVAQVGRLTSPITIQPEEPKARPAIRSDKSQARGKRPPVTKSLARGK
jgi:hypothetical protein